MKIRWVIKGSAVVALSLVCFMEAFGQADSPLAVGSVLHVHTSMTLVDVVAEETKTAQHSRALITDLKKDDFRVLDNGREMPIEAFDAGITRTASPVALWLIVQCNMGFPVEWASMFMRGRTQLLRPALLHLNKDDVVGVAHWCDNEDAKIDLQPTRDVDAALATIETIFRGRVPPENNPAGERAMPRMMELALANVANTKPARVPVFLFLYGDHNAAYAETADRILKDLLQTSAIVFGLNDQDLHYNPANFSDGGKVWHLVHYYSTETGGQYYSTSHPELFSGALDYMLTQMHLRYVLGFKPLKLDGKRHVLRVELTQEAKRRYHDPELRFRTEYIPVGSDAQ
jgi:hypothetical protein